MLKVKKGIALLLSLILMMFVAAGCGSNNGASKEEVAGAATTEGASDVGTPGEASPTSDGKVLKGKLVIWTFFDQVKEMAKKFEEKNPEVKVDVQIFPGDQYQTKLMSAIQSGDNVPDIFDLERGYIGKFINQPFVADLSAMGADELVKDYIPYVSELGKSDDGKVRAISDHSSPGGFVYQREVAKKYLGTDDPEQISGMVDSWDKVIELGKQVYEKSGGKAHLLSNTGDVFDIEAYNTEPWVKDGKLNIDPKWKEYYEVRKNIRNNNGDAKLPFMSAGWGNALNDGSVVLTAMPAWASFMIDNDGGKMDGKFGVAKTPHGFYVGGTYRSIYAKSENQELAYEFIKFVASPEWQEYNLGKTGNMPGNGAVYESQKDSYKSPLLGDQNVMTYYYDLVKSIPPYKADKYSEEVLSKWRKAAGQGVNDNADYEKVLDDFKKEVKAAFPDIQVD